MYRALCLAAAGLFSACVSPPSLPPEPNVLEVGSTDGSVVALANPEGTLKYLTSAVDEDEARTLRELAPNIEFVYGLDEDEMLARAAEFQGADAHLVTPAFLAAAENLHWVQAWSAGVDRYVGIDGLRDEERIVLTNMQGIHGPVIAEHVMALMLALSRDLPSYLQAQERGAWERDAGSGQRALAGSTLLVAGMGGIGTEVARRGHGFDMRVLATVRTKRPAPAFVSELGTDADFERFLPEADFVVIALPLTSETRGLFDARALDLMKDDAVLINIGRGPIVDTDALVAALREGRLGGVGLDVTDPEPLPAGHALWHMDNVVITPHVAGTAALTGKRRELLFRENVVRFGEGRPLLNVVDKAAGY